MPRGSAPGERRGGRKKGTPNKRTTETAEAMAAAARKIEDAMPEAFKGNAHELLMSVYKDPTLPMETRIDAAAKAIRFEVPPIGSIEPNRGDKPPAGAPEDAPRSTARSEVGEIVNRFQTASMAQPNGNGALKH